MEVFRCVSDPHRTWPVLVLLLFLPSRALAATSPTLAALGALVDESGVDSPAVGAEVDRLRLRLRDGRVGVRALLDPGIQEGLIGDDALAASGMRALGRSEIGLTVEVPIDRLNDPPGVPGIAGWGRPHLPEHEFVSQGTGVTGAAVAQASGVDGSGVIVAIIDTGWSRYQQAGTLGELGNYFALDFSGYGMSSGGGDHGTACAEIVHDMAPGAFLYLLNVWDDVSMAQAVTWAQSAGVEVITMSMGWIDDSFGDGTGPLGTIVQGAVTSGIHWVNSAGNYGTDHWDDTWRDFDGDQWLEWDSWGSDEGQSVYFYGGGYSSIYLMWDDFPVSCSDFDLYVYDSWGSEVASSEELQDCGAWATPREWIDFYPWYSDWYDIKVRRQANGLGEHLDLIIHYGEVEYGSAAHSIVDPATVPGVVTVAAMDWAQWATGPQMGMVTGCATTATTLPARFTPTQRRVAT